MIPVTLKPEPADFEAKVRQPGNDWLRANNIPLDGPLPPKTKLPTYWSLLNEDLWNAYDGTCAYLAIFFEFVTGAGSTDHFIAKSQTPRYAYEWSNFRLSCLGPNRNKNKYDDVLDPVGLSAGMFVLNLVSGEITPGPCLSKDEKARARNTIKRLKLASPAHNKMRQRHFAEYLRHKDSDHLKKLSPFVWSEADRQGLL
ncbi:hypothetical protein [Asticcacaulis sp.]|uniref:hypothetical protein n=1 Tax=Asticcacaulis sp. TaxID=1872648 RepID=UPI0026322903|nr:hypothetical protein [Asticcacaulis sp.]